MKERKNKTLYYLSLVVIFIIGLVMGFFDYPLHQVVILFFLIALHSALLYTHFVASQKG